MFLRCSILFLLLLEGAATVSYGQVVIWEYESASVSSADATNANDIFHSRFASEKRFGVPNRPLRRLDGWESATLSSGYGLRVMDKHNYGQEIDPTTKKLRCTQSIFRKSRNFNALPSPAVDYQEHAQDWHCLIKCQGSELNSGVLLPEETAYKIQFDVEVVDCYPSAWTGSKWFDDLTPGYMYVFQTWQSGSPPLTICLDSPGQSFNYWLVYQRYENASGGIEERHNQAGASNAQFDGPGLYRFEVLTDARPTGKGFVQVKVKGPNDSSFRTIADFTGTATYYPGLPSIDFGAYSSISRHDAMMSAMDADSDKIPNTADFDTMIAHISGLLDSDGDGVHDDADADTSPTFRELDAGKIDFEFLDSVWGENYQDVYDNPTQLQSHRGKGIDDRWARIDADVDGDGIPDFADVVFNNSSNTGIKPQYQLPSNAVDIEGDGVFHEQIQLVFDKMKVTKAKRADTDLDGDLDFGDFLALSFHYLQPGDWRNGDFNGDGNVDFTDFLIMSDEWGPGLPDP